MTSGGRPTGCGYRQPGGGRCRQLPTRPYPCGPRCDQHAPWALAGEPAPELQGQYCIVRRRFRVLASGSRTWTDTRVVTAALDRLRERHPADLVIVHGACPTGADAIADDWCRRNGIPAERYPADWARLGRRAGMERNAAMVATGPALCLAFIRDDSPDASHCAAAAESAGIPTLRHTASTQPVYREAPAMPDNPLLAAALNYAARGWHVIPLRPGQKRPAFPDHDADHCTGRDPRCLGGHVGWEGRATTDPDRIRRAWITGRYGVGVACGPSGLLVVDLDTPKPDTGPPLADWALPGVSDGSDVFAVLCERAGQPWPVTYTATTPRGGRHLYFRQSDGRRLGNTRGSTNGLGWLIDTRGHGGQVAASPTMVNGKPYTVLVDIDPAPMPEWLTEHLTAPAEMPRPHATVDLPTDRAGRFGAAALAGECEKLAQTQPGGHNDALYRAARILGELVAGGILPESAVRTALADTAMQLAASAGCDCTARGIERTISSGLRAGARRPRTVAA